MTALLRDYHPDIAPLFQVLREALHASLAQSAVRSRTPWRIVLARVSDQSRKKFQENLDQDMDWLCGHSPVAWVKANVTDVEAFRATPAGERARAAVGMHPLYAPGTKRLIGGFLARDGWLFVFLLSSAAKADLPQGRNAATEAILASLLAVAHDDPHDTAGRPLLYAHALDRILRAEEYAWAVFTALTRTYALVDAAGRSFDALGANSKDEWTLVTFGAARGRDDIARRFLLSRLNKLRAGNWPGNAPGLPRGFTPSAEPDANGWLNLTPTDKQTSVRRPVPDPRQRWAVRAIVAAALDPKVTKMAQLATACGHAGLTARGADEVGLPLDKTQDKTSAGRLLLTPVTIRAYCTGLLRHTETGVTAGQFNPGDGHRLLPRYPGDALGAYTNDVRVGMPEDDGWSWGVTPKEWRDILLKWWLPRDFTPNGWSWNDAPKDWGWDQILDASGTPPEQDTGRAAANDELRPFSGLIRWSDDGHRNLLHCGSSTKNGDRYEWRREPHAASRRDSNGNLCRMASTDGDSVSSWTVKEFHHTWATLAQQALTELIADEPTLPLSLHPESSRLSGAISAMPSTVDAALAAREAEAQALRAVITELEADVNALMLAAARKLMKGDERGADSYETQAEAKQQSLADSKRELEALLAAPVPVPATPSAPTADFGRPAAVIAALTGPFATGPAPKALREAIRAMGGAETRLYVVDATTVRMKVEVSVRRTDGTLASAIKWGTVGRSRPNLNTEAARERRKQAKADLARKWFYEGLTVEELTKLSGASALHTYRIVREQLATGGPRVVGQAPLGSLAADRIPQEGLRAAITMHPVAEARACVWSALNPADPAPPHVPAGYPALMEETYRQAEHAWDPRNGMRDPRTDGRVDVLTMLRHLPDPTAPIPAQHVADLVGIPVRYVNAISASGSRGQTLTPASLQRVGGWGGSGSSNLPVERRSVTLLACPWQDCDSATADAVLLLPEILIGAATSVVCRTCLRPPTRNVAFPVTYRTVLASVEARTGTWAQCATPGCTTDLGAGPGVLWRWDDTPAHHVAAHRGCMPASQRPPSNAEIRLWASRHGHAITGRGRIPAPVLDAYQAHHARHDAL